LINRSTPAGSKTHNTPEHVYKFGMHRLLMGAAACLRQLAAASVLAETSNSVSCIAASAATPKARAHQA
jgi:hypothetical protein